MVVGTATATFDTVLGAAHLRVRSGMALAGAATGACKSALSGLYSFVFTSKKQEMRKAAECY